jgi:hypothetical protein
VRRDARGPVTGGGGGGGGRGGGEEAVAVSGDGATTLRYGAMLRWPTVGGARCEECKAGRRRAEVVEQHGGSEKNDGGRGEKEGVGGSVGEN